MLFEQGQTPPSQQMRDMYGIIESWRVYDTADGYIFGYVSPLRGATSNRVDAIAHAMGDPAQGWPGVSADRIRWLKDDDLGDQD